MSFGGKKPTNENTEVKVGRFPALSTKEFRQLRRIPFVFDEQSMAMAIEIAACEVQRQLPETIEITGAHVSLYKRAVYSLAHADLLPEFSTQAMKDAGQNTAEDATITGDRFRAQSNRDIHQLLSQSSNCIELI